MTQQEYLALSEEERMAARINALAVVAYFQQPVGGEHWLADDEGEDVSAKANAVGVRTAGEFMVEARLNPGTGQRVDPAAALTAGSVGKRKASEFVLRLHIENGNMIVDGVEEAPPKRRAPGFAEE